ncbi:hypothetical protein G6F24_015237 [Rhizopus arrhizus]|nr:hypothetical protein G6F24_015237 [Rhizopus arrhizus]
MEFLVMNDALRRAVMRRDGMGEIERIAREAGMRTMYEDGLSKALSGQTTIEEVLRGTQSARRDLRRADGSGQRGRTGRAPAGPGPPADGNAVGRWWRDRWQQLAQPAAPAPAAGRRAAAVHPAAGDPARCRPAVGPRAVDPARAARG